MTDGLDNLSLPKPKISLSFAAFVITIIVLNLVLLDYLLISGKFWADKSSKSLSVKEASQAARPSQVFIASTSAGCNLECQKLIDQKIAELKTQLQTQTVAPQAVVQTIANQTPGERTVYFGSSGSTTSTNWTDLSDGSTSLNLADYPGAKQFKFVATLRSDAPDRKAYARIFNTSGNIEIWQSEISYAGLNNKTIESALFPLSGSQLNLKVQIKSFLLNTSFIENPQLKIIY